MKSGIKFGVFADLHVDIIHDPMPRLQAFLDDCRRQDVDFIIQLGDFCYPDVFRCICRPENRPSNIQNALDYPAPINKDEIVQAYRNFEKPSFHVLGNHECDLCSKEEALEYYCGEVKPYYSFDMGGFHFIVLDGNFYRTAEGEYVSYCCGNYFDTPFDGGSLPWLPPEQMEWLRQDLEKTAYPSVVFSHQSLFKGTGSFHNRDELREVFKSAPKGVLLSVNGHEHLDYLTKDENVWIYSVNSMSNCWAGDDYVVEGRYGKEMDEKFPNLKFVFPYEGPVYSIITLTEEGMKIDGTSSVIVGKMPEEFGLGKGQPFYEHILYADITADSKNHAIRWEDEPYE